jgi:hypothetical protein
MWLLEINLCWVAEKSRLEKGGKWALVRGTWNQQEDGQ